MAWLRPEGDREVTFLVGLALLSLGLYFAWPPGALIVPGVVLTLLGIFATPAPPSRREPSLPGGERVGFDEESTA